MKNRYGIILLIAVVSSIYMAFMYVNPYNSEIALSDIILQLSGSKGEFELGFSYSELMEFLMKLFPLFAFELYAGIKIYQNFCTASVYIFSRQPHRIRWYIKESISIMIMILIFNLILLTGTCLVVAMRYNVYVDKKGIIFTIYYYLIYTLWTYIMVMLVNILSIYLGSSTAYAAVISAQIICVVVLNIMDFIVRNSNGQILYEELLRWNPIAHLIFGWHNECITEIEGYVTTCMNINLGNSLVLMIVAGIVVAVAGGIIIDRHDLLVSDLEKRS